MLLPLLPMLDMLPPLPPMLLPLLLMATLDMLDITVFTKFFFNIFFLSRPRSLVNTGSEELIKDLDPHMEV